LLFVLVRTTAQPIALHPANPHYFEYLGKPHILITSAEHYGAVVNKDFDYVKYLSTLHREGMNYTRIFVGSYIEIPGSFGIEHNTLSPITGSFIAPWNRVDATGLFENEGKFDLEEWNVEYFERLKAFMQVAKEKKIIVEVVFFCATYSDDSWRRHPFNAANNINDVEEILRADFNSLKNPRIVHYQEALLRKITTELNGFDNVIYELSNEPWADEMVHVSILHKTMQPNKEAQKWQYFAPAASADKMHWQKRLAQVFRETESILPHKHLLAQNYGNFKQNLTQVDEEIDIINFHYVWPEAVTQNYGWERPISFDESGFAGKKDSTYLSQAWSFILAGGAVFNNLDYSFYVGKENGTGMNKAPGGGSVNLRRQLNFLKTFIMGFDFVNMKPIPDVVYHSPGMESYCLANDGKEYALYFNGRNQGIIKLNLVPAEYVMRIFSPESGKQLSFEIIDASQKVTTIRVPIESSLAISLVRN